MSKFMPWKSASRTLALAACLMAVGAASSAQALQVLLEVAGGTGEVEMTPNGTLFDNPEIDAWVLNTTPTVDGVQVNSWTALLKEDPFVTNNINVTNTTGVTQTIIATVILPIPAFDYSLAIASSVGLTATDSDGNGVLSVSGTPNPTPPPATIPLFQGLVNGTSELDLDTTIFPLTLAACGGVAGCSATSDSGVPVATAIGPGTATSIGVRLQFDLSPFDSAGLTSRFEIVPEPGTGLLVGLGLLGLAARRRSA